MKRKLNNEEMAAFCSQMALILRSGISAFEGISMMMEDQERRLPARCSKRFTARWSRAGTCTRAL